MTVTREAEGSAKVVRADEQGATDRNEVVVEGRVSAAPERRTLPSGDEVVALRVVVRRGEGGVDTLPVAVGPAPPAGTRPKRGQVGRRLLGRATKLPAGARVRVRGTLRRRWWRTGGDLRSRIEVRAATVEPLDDEASVDGAR